MKELVWPPTPYEAKIEFVFYQFLLYNIALLIREQTVCKGYQQMTKVTTCKDDRAVVLV